MNVTGPETRFVGFRLPSVGEEEIGAAARSTGLRGRPHARDRARLQPVQPSGRAAQPIRGLREGSYG
jgi:hypothetical protein